MNKIAITACICTYKRVFLEKTLRSLMEQNLDNIMLDFVIIDNDCNASAKEIVDEVFIQSSFSYQYGIEKEKNISVVRNHSIKLARGDWLFFIDDDEIAGMDLLHSLLSAAHDFDADLVAGIVVPSYPLNVPKWIVDGKFFVRERTLRGAVIESAGTGNILIKNKVLKKNKLFDERFGLTGGEDTELTYRLNKQGAKIISCPGAIATEVIEKDRVNATYLMTRAIRGGETYIRAIINQENINRKLLVLLKSLVGLPVYFLLVIVNWPMSKIRYFKYVLKLLNQYGKVRAILFPNKRVEVYKKS